MAERAWMECRYCNGLFNSAAAFIRHKCNQTPKFIKEPSVPYQLTEKDRILLSVLNISTE